MDTETCYVVLWSPSQRAVHVETASDMAMANRRTFLDEEPNDFVVLEFAADEDAAHDRAVFFEQLRDARDGIRR